VIIIIIIIIILYVVSLIFAVKLRHIIQWREFRDMLLTFWNKFNRLKPSGFFTYHQVSGLTLNNSTWCSLSVDCFARISEQTTTFSLYAINLLFFVAVVESVYSAVRTDALYKAY